MRFGALLRIRMKKAAVVVLGRDDVAIRRVRTSLRTRGYQVIESRDKNGLPQTVQTEKPDLVIILLPQNAAGEELEWTNQIRTLDRRLPVIWTAPNHTGELLLTALRSGVKDYLREPFSTEELIVSIDRCLHGCLSRQATESQPSDSVERRTMIGDGAAMRETRGLIARVAATDSNALITGETGTGKELVAELIHMKSSRCRKPMISINCSAIPESLLESELFGYERGAFTGADFANAGKLKLAEGGTVFFDEIGDMSTYAQAKILRAIESREIHRLGGRRSISLNIRVIAATNQDLEAKVEEGSFRKDLYYRLSVARIHLPPLRQRKEDIPALLDYYVRGLNVTFRRDVEGFTEEALQYLLGYDWPGNIRELKNLLEETFINASPRQISLHDFPQQFRNKFQNGGSENSSELDCLISALVSVNWNKSLAAQKLKWSRMTLYRKMAKYRLALRQLHKARSEITGK
jgi:DNA-binding NtrC family response regulator